MSSSDDQSNKYPELVFGLVGAVGCDLVFVENILKDRLAAVGYTSEPISLSERIGQSPLGSDLPKKPEEDRLAAYMNAGNAIRKETKRGDALGLLAIARIREIREEKAGEATRPIPRCAYILRSLKHDSEVDRLRRIYGPGFFLVGAYSPYEDRLKCLAKKIANSRGSEETDDYLETARALIERDKFEAGSYGQRVRETFCKADVFIDLRDQKAAKQGLRRFIEILFGHPNHTPNPIEAAMFHAHAAAVRSGSLARQVGAAIATKQGDIIATGANDVPRAHGGLYNPHTDPDQRDFNLGFDSNSKMKVAALQEVLSKLCELGWLNWDAEDNGSPPPSRLEEAREALKDSRIMNITEFGREVHAEMDALLSAARRGVSVRDAVIYSTTFPCHNCAKHIVAAGIDAVYYIEPYPKSMASELFKDSILVDPTDGKADKDRVPFQPFVGIGARRYMDLFSMVNSEGWKVKRKDGQGDATEWDAGEAYPRLPMWERSYAEREASILPDFLGKLSELGDKERDRNE